MPPATPIIGTNTIHPNNQQEQTPQPVYSEARKKYINFRRQRMIAARDQRDAMRDEYDGMGFLQYIDMLKKHDDQYIAPRKNRGDTSINLGTIRDKDTTLVEYAAKFDFTPSAQCYNDADDSLTDLAETAEDLVKKSLFMEDDEVKQKLVSRAMIAFGTTFVEDMWVEQWVHDKQPLSANGFDLGNDNAKWIEKLKKTYEGCQYKLWDIRKCYVGDIRKFFLNGPQGQPFFFTVEYESYDVVKGLFGEWDMWKYVPTHVTYEPVFSQAGFNFSSAWTLRPVTQNYCEIIRYYDPIANEFSITINGIEMLPIMERKNPEYIKGGPGDETLISGFPLTAISPSGCIPFAKFDNEPLHDFWLSKSQPGKMRVIGDVENMLIKVYIRQMKQKARPTLGNKSGRSFGPEIWDEGTVINDIRDGDLFPIVPNYAGINQADFSFFELVKKELDKTSVTRAFQGDKPDQTEKTATAEMDEMRASSLKVAALIDGLIFGRRQLFALRNYNIMKNWTKPIDTQIDTVNKTLVQKYRTITLPSEVDGGQKAVKKIIFSKDTSATSQEIHQKEIDIKSGKYHEGRVYHPSVKDLPHNGHETRIALLHPELYATVKLQWHWECVPVPNGNDPLTYMMFAKHINDAMAFFGPDSLNVKRLKHKFANISGVDFDTWFISEMELQQKQQMAQMQQQQGQTGNKSPNSMSGNGNSTDSMLAEHGSPSIQNMLQKNMPGNNVPQIM